MIIKKGNTVFMGFALTDSDGNTISDLSSANDIVFELKLTKTGSAAVTKNLADGVSANQDKLGNTVTGSVRVVIPDTEINALSGGTNYFVGVEIQWTNNRQEVFLTENGQILEYITIKQDVV